MASFIVLLGAPGAGKGTAAEALRDQCGYLHLSTGDLLREAIRSESELGKAAKEYMARGDLVPDALILSLVRDILARSAPDARVLFDGFPRTIEQAVALDALLAETGGRLRAVFQLIADEELVVRRLSGRRICRDCAAVFNVNTMPPRVEGVCDHCGGTLIQRPDDNEATVRNRLAVYVRQSAPLVEYYRRQELLFDVDARDRDTTLAGIQAVLDPR
ncbi:MAG: adenylate kinase [Kiritimatiellae bacterium]|nr:adenylate kinase [Kiritimatiellia bacterium]